MSSANRQRLTWAEIRQRYPDEWVALAELDSDLQELEIRSGIVLGHGKSRRELTALSKSAANRGTRAILFTGEIGQGSYRF